MSKSELKKQKQLAKKMSVNIEALSLYEHTLFSAESDDERKGAIEQFESLLQTCQKQAIEDETY